MDLRRISNPTEKDFARIKKYRCAHALLRAMDKGLFTDTEWAILSYKRTGSISIS